MNKVPDTQNQVQHCTSFQDLVARPFQGQVNALCWKRELEGNFEELVEKIACEGNMMEVNETLLLSLSLSEQGKIARQVILQDVKLLRDFGADPVLNIIQHYERDESFPFFPCDVYSFHVDRSPIPTATFLCTYFGASSEILPNAQAIQKVLVPEIRTELRKLYDGDEAGFEDFLIENFFDLHYQEKAGAEPISLGQGHLWRLAVDYPESSVLPCVHRAPLEKEGQARLLLIC